VRQKAHRGGGLCQSEAQRATVPMRSDAETGGGEREIHTGSQTTNTHAQPSTTLIESTTMSLSITWC